MSPDSTQGHEGIKASMNSLRFAYHPFVLTFLFLDQETDDRHQVPFPKTLKIFPSCWSFVKWLLGSGKWLVICPVPQSISEVREHPFMAHAVVVFATYTMWTLQGLVLIPLLVLEASSFWCSSLTLSTFSPHPPPDTPQNSGSETPLSFGCCIH